MNNFSNIKPWRFAWYVPACPTRRNEIIGRIKPEVVEFVEPGSDLTTFLICITCTTSLPNFSTSVANLGVQ